MQYSAQLPALGISFFLAVPAYAGTPVRETSAEVIVADAALRTMRDADAVLRVIADHATEHRADAPARHVTKIGLVRLRLRCALKRK